MSFNRTKLPTKGKIESDITGSIETEQNDNQNTFKPVTYHGKNWLFGFFGSKDGSEDQRYFGLKAETATFASECYRMLGDFSPKYRPVYGQDGVTASGFITKKIEQPFVALDMIFDFLDVFEKNHILYAAPSFPRFALDKAKYFKEAKETIVAWGEAQKTKIKQALALMQPILTDEETEQLNKNLCELFTYVQGEAITYLLHKERSSEIYSMAEVTGELVTCFREAKTKFIDEELKPIKDKLIQRFREILQANGLANIIAIAFALGEGSLKARDILLDASGRVYKLDHERCLWEVIYTFLYEITPCTKSHSVWSATPFLEDPETIIKMQAITSQDIDTFPKRESSPALWFLNQDEDNPDPEWFNELLQEESFRHQGYVSLLAFALVPDAVLKELSRVCFKPVYGEDIANHIVRRKDCLQEALYHSKEFTAFFMKADDLESGIRALCVLHNKNWAKEKYAAIQIDLEVLHQNFAAFKTHIEMNKDKVDSNVNCIYVLKPPSLSAI